MLKCECDRCHKEMEVPLSATPFIMPDPNGPKSDFMIFQHIENNQMEQLHLCPSCEKLSNRFLTNGLRYLLKKNNQRKEPKHHVHTLQPEPVWQDG